MLYASKYSADTFGMLVHDELMIGGSVIISFKDVSYFDSDIFIEYLFKRPLNQKVYTYIFRGLCIIECSNNIYKNLMDSILDYLILVCCDKDIFDNFNYFKIRNAPFSLSKIIHYPNYKITVDNKFQINSAYNKNNVVILSENLDGETFENLKIKELGLDVEYSENTKKIIDFKVDDTNKVINLYTEQEEV